MPETAARTALAGLIERVPTASPQENVGALVERLGRPAEPVPAAVVYLVDAAGAGLGVVPVAALLSASPQTPLHALAQPLPPTVAPDADQEAVASHAIAHGIAAVPVADAGGRLLGVVPPLALMRVLRQEHVEDMHRFAGILRESEQASRAIEEPPTRRARHRLPWLLAGLAGSVISAMVMRHFEATLQANVAVAFFIPAIVYLADAVGTQSEAIAVRGLSLSRKPLLSLLGGELRTGALIGLVLSLLALLPVWLLAGQLQLAVALFAASSVATVIGFTLPWLLERTGTDPAFGSGPLATTVQDVLSLLIYFVTVAWMLG
mgnify:CR=1 FL=1